MRFEPLEPRAMLAADAFADAGAVVLSSPAQAPVYEGEELYIFGEEFTLPYVPLEDTFKLHSLPSANHTIYLDFNGHRTEHTQWNEALLENTEFEGAAIDTPPYDTDGDELVFSEMELLSIQEAFLRVAEDFAPFNVNVTTEEPADLDDLMNTGGLDERWGLRVVIGGLSTDWYILDPEADPIGGVALGGSFSDAIDTPAFAFAESGYEIGKNLAEVISHETGHTLGLGHDGILPDPDWDPDAEPDPEDPDPPMGPVEYYPGHGDWAAIMGVGYAPPITQWSKGEYYRASNDQDDLAIIASAQNGFGYRVDDHAGDVLGATHLQRDPPTTESILNNEIYYSTTGLIEQNTDYDYFEFYSQQGSITIDAVPVAYGPNLDIKIELHDSFGNVLAVGAPDNELTASLQATALVPGFYYVVVTGDRSQEIPQPVTATSTDYTDYGSLGEYAVNIVAPVGPPPDSYEPNDFLGNAIDLPVADYTVFGNFHQGGDEDVYKWTAGEDGTLVLDLRFEHDEADIDLKVYDQNGGQIAVAASSSDNEFLEIPVESGKSYYARVYAPGAVLQLGYEFWIDGPGVPLDGFTSRDGTIDLQTQYAGFDFDLFDEASLYGPVESNDTMETALWLESDDPSTAAEDYSSEPDYHLDMSIHRPGDEDYLVWTSPGTGSLILDVLFDTNQANIDVEVSRVTATGADGEVTAVEAVPNGVGDSADDNEQVIVDVSAGETFLIHVHAQPGTIPPGDALYTLNLDGPEIDFDPYELNNTLAQASTALDGVMGVTIGLSVHSPIDADYFAWTAPETGDFRARAFFFHENGDLDLQLLNADGDVLAASTSLDDNESVTERVVGGRTYYVVVFGYDGATQSNYALDFAFAASLPVPGDYDGNGYVDLFDRELWRSFYGATAGNLPEGETELRADGNADGVVNAADFTIWRDNQGEGRRPQDHTVADSDATRKRVSALDAAPFMVAAGLPVVDARVEIDTVDLIAVVNPDADEPARRSLRPVRGVFQPLSRTDLLLISDDHNASEGADGLDTLAELRGDGDDADESLDDLDAAFALVL